MQDAQPADAGTRERTAVVAGLGAWVPHGVVTNDELARVLDTSDEWIRSRTGIGRRHVVSPGESTGDLAVEAGRRALASAAANGGDRTADAVVLATSTPDRPCPATAPEVASRLGLGGVAAFDISAVCSGFVYALGVSGALITSGAAERVLVVGADTFSTILDPGDRTTRAVFGDGAGAVLLRAGQPTERGALRGLTLGSDGTRSDLIQVPGGGSRLRSAGEPARDADAYFTMAGRPVFGQAVRRMADSVRASAAELGWAVSDVDRVVLHQANARITAAVADRLDLPVDRFPSNIGQVGNTVAASIPLALADAAQEGVLRPGHRVVLCGFGGGLTWGALGLVWPQVKPV
ncbi:beta-ketoacyl-ACP synthase III [Streptomyces sp. NPDC048219]|uniref:beta-ketoacyl-ACP synthase III n=1 Tax=Streptomyces sp. NPDC048219 TaxID=3365517 RepID=UPI00372384F7